MKAFNIGDRVRVKEYYDIPEEYRTKGLARLCGEVGVISDKLYSECKDCFVYSIKFDSFDVVSKKIGVLGIAQAASYALKKLYQKLGGEIDG